MPSPMLIYRHPREHYIVECLNNILSYLSSGRKKVTRKSKIEEEITVGIVECEIMWEIWSHYLCIFLLEPRQVLGFVWSSTSSNPC